MMESRVLGERKIEVASVESIRTSLGKECRRDVSCTLIDKDRGPRHGIIESLEV